MTLSWVHPLQTIPIIDTALGFLTFGVIFGGLLGLYSKRLSVATYGAILVFVKVALETNVSFFRSMLYISLVATFILLGFQVWDFTTQQGDTV